MLTTNGLPTMHAGYCVHQACVMITVDVTIWRFAVIGVYSLSSLYSYMFYVYTVSHSSSNASYKRLQKHKFTDKSPMYFALLMNTLQSYYHNLTVLCHVCLCHIMFRTTQATAIWTID